MKREKPRGKNPKKDIGIFLLLLSLVPLSWAGVRLGTALKDRADFRFSYTYEGEFQYSELYETILEGGYQKNRPVKDMAEKLERCMPMVVPAMRGPFVQETMELPIDITYYAEPSQSSEPVLKFQKGEKVKISPDTEGAWPVNGYGCIGLPDYRPGWRCVKPFIKGGSGESVEELPYYYIPLQDLETILRQYTAEINAQAKSEMSKIGKNQKDFYRILLACDLVLYRKGIYNSPELEYPVWDTWDTVLVSASGILLLSGIILWIANGKGKRAKAGAGASNEENEA